ncbi:MAG TPA: HlyD family efflux transporter periplasmic adaptor subunit [Candidatus Tectomicrobia bacterium]
MTRVLIKRSVLMLAGVGLVGLLVWALWPEPVAVEMATARHAAFEQTIDKDGKTRVRERYVVSAPLADRVPRPTLKAGDVGQASAVVAVMRPSLAPFLDQRMRTGLEERLRAAEAAQLHAQARVEHAEAALKQAIADAERVRRLGEKNCLSRTQVEQAALAVTANRKDLDTAHFEAHAAEPEVAQARAALPRLGTTQAGAEPVWQIRSPVCGSVLHVLQKSVTVVTLGTPLLEIGQAANLEVVVDVLTTEAVQIQPGATVWLERWGQDQRVLEGRVRRVEPGAFTKVAALGIEEQRTNVIIDIVSPPEQWHTLGDGYKVDARMVVFRQDAAVTVPVGTVFREGERRAVFVARHGVAQKRRIETPRRNSQNVLVTSELTPGEQVIVYPSQAVEGGVRVKPR